MRAARPPEIPSASMADVAFLLLLFFLVATAIRSDSGLPFTLAPPLPYDPPLVEPVTLPVFVDAAGALRLDGAPVAKADVRGAVAAFAPSGRLVEIRTHRRTPYAATIAALDAVRLGFGDADRPPRIAKATPVGEAAASRAAP